MIEWRTIQDFPIYEVSNTGIVRNKRDNNKVLKPAKNHKGYFYVRLYNNPISKCITIHRLVAKAFIENPNNYLCVNHKDENKLNNNVDNLEWCSTEYNNNYGKRNSKVGIHNEIPVVCDFNNNIVIYKSIKIACDYTKLPRISIAQVLSHKRNSCYKSLWRYANVNEIELLGNNDFYGNPTQIK